ncbi:hypothetical protein V2J09_016467 [Rumex salicifolius]
MTSFRPVHRELRLWLGFAQPLESASHPSASSDQQVIGAAFRQPWKQVRGNTALIPMRRESGAKAGGSPVVSRVAASLSWPKKQWRMIKL